MKNWMFFIGMALMLFGGCQEDEALVTMDDMAVQARDVEYTAKQGEQIVLYIGQKVMIEPEGFTIMFKDVLEDNRCPTELDCIWEGRAVVQLEFEKVDDCVVTALESPNSRPEYGNVTNIFEKSVKLLKVCPYPKESNVISMKHYQVVLRVDKPVLTTGDGI